MAGLGSITGPLGPLSLCPVGHIGCSLVSSPILPIDVEAENTTKVSPWMSLILADLNSTFRIPTVLGVRLDSCRQVRQQIARRHLASARDTDRYIIVRDKSV